MTTGRTFQRRPVESRKLHIRGERTDVQVAHDVEGDHAAVLAIDNVVVQQLFTGRVVGNWGSCSLRISGILFHAEPTERRLTAPRFGECFSEPHESVIDGGCGRLRRRLDNRGDAADQTYNGGGTAKRAGGELAVQGVVGVSVRGYGRAEAPGVRAQQGSTVKSCWQANTYRATKFNRANREHDKGGPRSAAGNFSVPRRNGVNFPGCALCRVCAIVKGSSD